MIILGVETSCDETALALLEARNDGATAGNRAANSLELRLLGSLVRSQADLHDAYGGVFPSLAKREHGRNLVPLLRQLLAGTGFPGNRGRPAAAAGSFSGTLDRFRPEMEAKNPELFAAFAGADFLKEPKPDIDAVAVTEGPGLEPALWTGINLAGMLGCLWSVPVIPVNHMEGHIIGSFLPDPIPENEWFRPLRPPLPAAALLVSGGHTELVRVDGVGRYAVLGQTRDDAVGEAFDKAARLLGLPYPGGPRLSELADSAIEKGVPALALPRPMLGRSADDGRLDFSFSGLKTAVLYAVRKASAPDGALAEDFRLGLARGFQEAAADVLCAKLEAAAEACHARSVIIGGGVSANRQLRQRLSALAERLGLPIFLPSRQVSGDNALMIAAAAALGAGERAETTDAVKTKDAAAKTGGFGRTDGGAFPRPIRADGNMRLG